MTEPIVLATKGRFGLDDAPNSSGLSARHLTRALDASLRRLGVDAVDLYQLHASDPLTPMEETLRTLDGFVRAGKIRYYGLSNFTGWQLTKAAHLADALNIARPVTLQPQYSLLVREIEWEIVPAAIDAGLGLLPWSPLGGGWLSGKYRRDQRPTGATRLGDDPNRGMEAYDRRGTPRTWAVIDAVQKVADERGVSMAEVALAWVTGRPGVTATILGARTIEQLESNLRSADAAAHRRGDRRARRGQRPPAARLPLRRAGPGPARPPPAGTRHDSAVMNRKRHSYLRGELVVVIDCSDLGRSGDFWTSVLGYVRERPGSDRYQTLLPADGEGAEILLQRVPERKQGKNRLHLDLRTRDLEAEVERMTGLGAGVLDRRAGHRGRDALAHPGRPRWQRVLRAAAARVTLAGLAK